MATINETRGNAGPVGAEIITWTPITEADVGRGALVMGASGAVGAMQVNGTFGSATITLQGSNDGTNFYALTDPAGNDVALGAAGIIDFSTAAAYIRPATAGGTGSSLTVTVCLRG